MKLFKALRKGFTIVELVIVIAVIAILAAVLIPTFSNIIDSANESSALSECKNAYIDLNNQMLISNKGTWNGNGTVMYCNGYYFTVIDGEVISFEKYEKNDEGPQGEYKIFEIDSEYAGRQMLASMAKSLGLSYTEVKSGHTTNCYVNNYYTFLTVGETSYRIEFYRGSNSINEEPNALLKMSQDKVYFLGGVIRSQTSNTTKKQIKNVIFLIADGGGYDNFTLAGEVKQELINRSKDKIDGAKTQITTNTLSSVGLNNVQGLYLNEFLIGSANTLLVTPHGTTEGKQYITDSSAAGTALSSGYKTTYCYSGIDSAKMPNASLTELAKMNGMSTGIVTTKSFVDATPLAFFTAHSIERYEYQDTSYQALTSGVDVVIVEGTEYGDLVSGTTVSSHPDVSATSMGYTVAKSKTEMINKANDTNTKKLWTSILGVNNSSNTLTTLDQAADHITYDVDASISAEQPSLLEMSQSALKVLGNNINDPDGFFLMIEGGALDNAAEGGQLRGAIGEYLAFDETFAYCVNWAKNNGDNTMVIACPDHDSGGFYGIESCKSDIIDAIITGKIGTNDVHSNTSFNTIKNWLTTAGKDTSDMGIFSGHSDMVVPISLYCPDYARADMISALGLPSDASKDKPRILTKPNSSYYVPSTGSNTWYKSSVIDNDYTIENTALAPAIAKIAHMGNLSEATQELYVYCGHYDGTNLDFDTIGITFDLNEENLDTRDTNSDYYPSVITVNGKNVLRNNTGYTDGSGTHSFTLIGNLAPKSLFIYDTKSNNNTSVVNTGTIYLPISFLQDNNIFRSIKYVCLDEHDGKMNLYYVTMDTERLGIPPCGYTVPGKTFKGYYDGTNMYQPGDRYVFGSNNNVIMTAIFE